MELTPTDERKQLEAATYKLLEENMIFFLSQA